jgi:hypothetical protein
MMLLLVIVVIRRGLLGCPYGSHPMFSSLCCQKMMSSGFYYDVVFFLIIVGLSTGTFVICKVVSSRVAYEVGILSSKVSLGVVSRDDKL